MVNDEALALVLKRNPRRFINSVTGQVQENYNRQQVLDLIEHTPHAEYKALCAILYLTGARISEIVKTFRWKQITQHEKEKGVYWYINELITLKKRNKDISLSTRTIPILYKPKEPDKYYSYKPFFDPILQYIKAYNIPHNQPIFQMTDRLYRLRIDEMHGIFPHYFRHLRATHLVRYHGYDAFKLKRFFGWGNIKSSEPYINVVVDDLL